MCSLELCGNVLRCICCVSQLVVEHEEVRLHMDCGEADRTTFHRSPDSLTFSHDSGIFVSNAGVTGLNKFVVSGDVHQPAGDSTG